MTKPLGRPSTWDQHADEMVRLYEDERKSRGEIARQYGTSVQTVTRVLSRHGVVFEDRQGNANAGRTPEQQAAINAKISASKKGQTYTKKPREKRTCVECGNEFAYRPGKTGEKLCSRSCRNRYNAKINKATAQEQYETDPKRCPCGSTIPFEYRHTRMFCSPEHRKEYSAKRQPDPANYVTFNCGNCGKEVKRLRIQGSHKYCSNRCAQRHTKVKKHYAIADLEIVFDSSYECLFWSLCAVLKIPIERFDRQYGVAWGEDCWYAPDFWLPSLGVAVEIKGPEDGKDATRWIEYRKQRGPLKVLVKDDLTDMVISKGDLMSFVMEDNPMDRVGPEMTREDLEKHREAAFRLVEDLAPGESVRWADAVNTAASMAEAEESL